MELSDSLPGPLLDGILGFRFGVFFFPAAPLPIPNPIDFRFQKVSGLSVEVKTTEVDEGGQNLYSHKLPDKIGYGNLVLERGMVVGSPLNIELKTAMSLFKFNPSIVTVVLFGEDKIPVASWMFYKTYPVKWSTSDLDAKDPEVLIDTMELAYSRMQVLRI